MPKGGFLCVTIFITGIVGVLELLKLNQISEDGGWIYQENFLANLSLVS